jgi:hypothetical protein
VVKTARFSDSGAGIRGELMHQLNKKLAEKETELRKLRLLHIRLAAKRMDGIEGT